MKGGERWTSLEAVLNGSGTILLVDDEDIVLDIGAEMLEKMGYEALTAKTGKKATEKSAPETIMDVIQNSKGNVGIETLKEKTGFQGQKLYSTLSILKKRGKVKNPSKGIYVKAWPYWIVIFDNQLKPKYRISKNSTEYTLETGENSKFKWKI